MNDQCGRCGGFGNGLLDRLPNTELVCVNCAVAEVERKDAEVERLKKELNFERNRLAAGRRAN